MTRITSPFGFSTTAAEVVEGVDLTGKRVVITGGTNEIGAEAARALAGAGAEVTLGVRDVEAGREVAAGIAGTTGNPAVHVAPLDLQDRASLTAFACGWEGPLDVLVANAGVMHLPRLSRSPEGWEAHLATNHLGHFVLTAGLHRALAAAEGARVVVLSSPGHLLSPMVFDDLHFRFRPYDARVAYGQSKTANVLFAVGLTARWERDGILANAVAPGAVRSDPRRHADQAERTAWGAGEEYDPERPPPGWKTPQQGAATLVFAAASGLLASVGGRYLEDCHEAEPVAEGSPYLSGVAPYALDAENADRLWEETRAALAGA